MCTDSNDSSNRRYDLRPILGEIFRTCTHPGSIILRVDQIDRSNVSQNSTLPQVSTNGDPVDPKSVRLYLTDGQLLLQALLHRRVLDTTDIKQVKIGDFVEITEFSVKRASKKHEKGQVVYLSIKACRFFDRSSSSSWVPDTNKNDNVGSGPLTVSPRNEVVNAAHDDDTAVDQDKAGGFLLEDDHQVRSEVDASADALQRQHLSTIGGGNVFQNGATRLRDDTAVDKPKSSLTSLKILQEFGGSKADDLTMTNSADAAAENLTSSRRTSLKRKIRDESFGDEHDDPFETIEIDLEQVHRRRRTLFDQLHGDSKVESTAPLTPGRLHNAPTAVEDKTTTDKEVAPADLDIKSQTGVSHTPTQQPPESAQREPLQPPDPTPTPVPVNVVTVADEPPLHNLASLLNPPKGHSLPRKNYTVNVLAVVTHIGTSLITRPGSSFPPKRHIKIDDPSLHAGKYQDPQTKGITVAVYRDAANFKPAVGTVALFRGLVMQRLANRDVILNVYVLPKARPGLGSSRLGAKTDGGTADVGVQARSAEDGWFITSPALLLGLGHDVEGLENWWRSRQKDKDRVK